MFIHLGGEVAVSARSVITIFDIRHMKHTTVTREFMSNMEHTGRIVQIDEGEAKSVVVTDAIVYISPISSATLKKRAESVHAMDFLHG